MPRRVDHSYPIDVDVKTSFVQVTIYVPAYPQAAGHWRDQLTGANARRWGRIWIDPDVRERHRRRRQHLSAFGPIPDDDITRKHGKGHINRDECPGAMFIWETQCDADVEMLCATDNQRFGGDLYRALKREIERKIGPLGWQEVRFAFVE
jgi:hypothetical protein